MNGERVDVLLLTAAEDGTAVDDGEDGRADKTRDNTSEYIIIDKLSWQNCGVCKRGVQLGEVQKQPKKNLGEKETYNWVLCIHLSIPNLPRICQEQISQK